LKFWEAITAPLRKSAGPDWGVLERYLGWAFGGGVSASGIIVNPQNAMQAAAVYACLKVLSESVGMLPLCMYKNGPNGASTKDDSHPLWEVLHYQPNDYQTSVEFLEMLVMHLNLRGNAYAWVNRTRSGRIVEMIPLHPDMCLVNMDAQNNVTYRVGTEEGGTRDVPRNQILHIKGLTMNGWLGISPIAYARESIGLALATEKFGGQLFRNGAKPGGVLEVPGQLSEQAYKRLKDSFDASSTGENAHKTALLEEGTKFSKIAMTSDDAQFLETRKYQRAEIAGLFRVPAHMINDLEHATFSNIEHMSLEFVKFSLMPWLNRIEKAIRRDLFTPDDKKTHRVRFDISSLLRGDSASRTAYYAGGIQWGYLTRNEAREMESELGISLNPIDGLDTPLMPLNMADGTADTDSGDPKKVVPDGIGQEKPAAGKEPKEGQPNAPA
jgi:HK97 family phage portal protein